MAAYFSKARAEGKVNVIKARVADLKKIPGAAPGKVTALPLHFLMQVVHIIYVGTSVLLCARIGRKERL